ncbi:MAG: carboxypeptidase regulatory-like domain-containing protein [Candidatus Zipacnadales bacterium]
MTDHVRLRFGWWRGLGLGALLFLVGCSASDIRITPPQPGKGTLSLTVVDARTREALNVDVIVIIGGVRETLPAGETTLRITDIPLGEADPPVQPLTVTAEGYVTYFEQTELSKTATTSVEVELTQADPEISGTMTGTVTDSETGQPVVNAIISFTPNIGGSPDPVKGGTDVNGKYIIGGVIIGATIARAVAAGYLAAEKTIVVVQDAGGSKNDPLDFELIPSSGKTVVRGKVVNLVTRDAIEGASVEIGGQGPAITNAKGRFELADVPVGEQTLRVFADGYDPINETITVLPGMADLQIELAAIEDRPPPAPATISGTVTILNRPNNAGAMVKGIDVITEKIIDSDVTDEAGAYGLFVPPGKYRIVVTYEGTTISKIVTLPGGGRTLMNVDFQITAS